MQIANLKQHHAAMTKCGTLLGSRTQKIAFSMWGLLNCSGCLVPSLKRQTDG